MAKKTVVVQLGRNGDIYMVLKKIREPEKIILVCQKQFSGIAKELFRQVEIHEVDNSMSLDQARAYCRARFIGHKIVVSQQAEVGKDVLKGYFSYQDYQERQVEGL